MDIQLQAVWMQSVALVAPRRTARNAQIQVWIPAALVQTETGVLLGVTWIMAFDSKKKKNCMKLQTCQK